MEGTEKKWKYAHNSSTNLKSRILLLYGTPLFGQVSLFILLTNTLLVSFTMQTALVYCVQRYMLTMRR